MGTPASAWRSWTLPLIFVVSITTITCVRSGGER
jgi:hypothetical protein